MRFSSSQLLVSALLGNHFRHVSPVHVEPRHCHGAVKHLHLAVGREPTTEMTISFASKWAYPDVEAPLGGVHFGLTPYQLDRFEGEQEFPMTYYSGTPKDPHEHYYAPYQHHITLSGLEPDTTYYYIAVTGDRSVGIQALKDKPLKNHPSQHENRLLKEQARNATVPSRQERLSLRRRRLAPPPYDGSQKPCMEGYQVRQFTTAPVSPKGEEEDFEPITFAVIGDIGQFDHSRETLEHMRDHYHYHVEDIPMEEGGVEAGVMTTSKNRIPADQDISATLLVGDIAYPEFDQRRWDTFFDFLDDFSIFDEVPLMVATGNHDIDKQEKRNEIFQAYEYRFRMPQVYPPILGTYDGPIGYLNMDAPPYPLPYEWGNAYYDFDYGPAKHIVVSAYSSMDPGSTQYTWLEETLQGVDRRKTPWVLVSIHVPLYNTFNLHHHDLQIVAAREHLEPLFAKHHVNVVFTGHIHAYQRTANVVNDTLVETGPVHITIGAGGRKCDAPFTNEEPEPWVIQRDASFYGYGTFHIFNRTHAHWRWIPLSASDQHDYNQVKGSDEHLPQLDHDQVIIDNQHYLAQE